MTICPIAIVSSCKQCPLYKVCPGKGIIGDDKKNDDKVPSERKKNR
jgi:hypothetical protein